MRKIKLSEYEQMINETEKDITSVRKNIYMHYKSIYPLSKSNSYYGGSAEAYKEYLQIGQINFINGILNICEEFEQLMKVFYEEVHMFEEKQNAVIDEQRLEEIKDEIAAKQRNCEYVWADVENVLKIASAYISIQSARSEQCDNTLLEIVKCVSDTVREMSELDEKLTASSLEMEERLESFKNMLSQALTKDYREYKIDIGGTALEGTKGLLHMQEKDPFWFIAGHDAMDENQAVWGLTKDIYAYAGYRLVGGTYEHSYKDNVYDSHLEGSVVQGNVYGQLTDYARTELNGKFIYGDVNGKAGWSDTYKGVNISGNAGVAKVDGKISAGSKDSDWLYAKGEAKVLDAEGYLKAEYEDGDNFSIGIKGEASAASAKGSIGTDLLSISGEDSQTGKKESLFGFEISGKVGPVVGAEASLERKKVWENENISIQTNTITLGGSFGIGGDITVTVPDISIKW